MRFTKENKEFILELMDKTTEQLDYCLDSIQSGDKDLLERMVEISDASKNAWMGFMGLGAILSPLEFREKWGSFIADSIGQIKEAGESDDGRNE